MCIYDENDDVYNWVYADQSENWRVFVCDLIKVHVFYEERLVQLVSH